MSAAVTYPMPLYFRVAEGRRPLRTWAGKEYSRNQPKNLFARIFVYHICCVNVGYGFRRQRLRKTYRQTAPKGLRRGIRYFPDREAILPSPMGIGEGASAWMRFRTSPHPPRGSRSYPFRNALWRPPAGGRMRNASLCHPPPKGAQRLYSGHAQGGEHSVRSFPAKKLFFQKNTCKSHPL